MTGNNKEVEDVKLYAGGKCEFTLYNLVNFPIIHNRGSWADSPAICLEDRQIRRQKR